MEIVTVSQLIQEVRDQADEQNTKSRDDDSILRMLNRGQRFICSQIVRTYPAPLLKRETVSLSGYSASAGIEIPRDAFEDRVLAVYINDNGGPTRVEQRDHNQVSLLATGSAQPVPDAWYIRGRRIVFAPAATGVYPALVDYVRQPDPLTLDQGRIESLDSGANAIVVDSIGANVASTADDLNSYVNIIDPLTGVVKGTLQVQSVVGNRIVFRTVPTRSTVKGRTVSSSLSSISAALDDYICISTGTCVPQFNQAYTTYVLQYGVAEVQRSLSDGMTSIAKAIAEDAQELAKSMESGRTRVARVKNTSSVWGGRRYMRYPSQG